MRTRSLSCLLVLFTLVGTPVWARQAVAAAPAAAAPAAGASARIWEGKVSDFEEFMRNEPFTRIEEVPIGVTHPKRGYYPPGGLVVSAAWKVLPPGRPNGYWESYKSEIAAYELNKLLGMDMVPPVVEKRWKGDLGAAILWLKPVRPWKEVEPLAKPDKWNIQAVRMKMFDNFIGNPDRNAGNLLVDNDWNLFLIDHSRAFISDKKLPAKMERIDKELWDRMKALDEAALTAALGKWVAGGEIRAILARREKMQQEIDKLIKDKTEAQVYLK